MVTVTQLRFAPGSLLATRLVPPLPTTWTVEIRRSRTYEVVSLADCLLRGLYPPSLVDCQRAASSPHCLNPSTAVTRLEGALSADEEGGLRRLDVPLRSGAVRWAGARDLPSTPRIVWLLAPSQHYRGDALKGGELRGYRPSQQSSRLLTCQALLTTPNVT